MDRRLWPRAWRDLRGARRVGREGRSPQAAGGDRAHRARGVRRHRRRQARPLRTIAHGRAAADRPHPRRRRHLRQRSGRVRSRHRHGPAGPEDHVLDGRVRARPGAWRLVRRPGPGGDARDPPLGAHPLRLRTRAARNDTRWSAKVCGPAASRPAHRTARHRAVPTSRRAARVALRARPLADVAWRPDRRGPDVVVTARRQGHHRQPRLHGHRLCKRRRKPGCAPGAHRSRNVAPGAASRSAHPSALAPSLAPERPDALHGLPVCHARRAPPSGPRRGLGVLVSLGERRPRVDMPRTRLHRDHRRTRATARRCLP